MSGREALWYCASTNTNTTKPRDACCLGAEVRRERSRGEGSRTQGKDPCTIFLGGGAVAEGVVEECIDVLGKCWSY
jgi:hypothetical protein